MTKILGSTTRAGFKLDQPAPIATVNELPDYDAIILGIPTRYGRMSSQMDRGLPTACQAPDGWLGPRVALTSRNEGMAAFF